MIVINHKNIILYSALILGLFLFRTGSLESSVVSRVVAEVNGEIVTSQEVDQILRPLYAKYQKAYSGDELQKYMESARKEALNQLIERKLVLQEAKKKNITVEEKEVEERLSQIRKKFDSEDEFYFTLEREGMTVDQLREDLNEQILARKLTRQEVMKSVMVRPKEITDYYNANVSKFAEPQKIQVGQILVKKGTDKEAALVKIKEAQAKLKEGVPFESVAKDYSKGPNASDGGNLPFYAKGELMKEIEKEAESMEVGQVSDIVETDLGYHILVLKAVKKDRQRPLSEVWKEIEDELFQQKAGELHKTWIEDLKKKAHIEIF